MKKRIVSLLLALTLAWSLTPPASAATYTDVPARHWAAGDIARATELGLFEGTGGHKFGLGQAITRAAYVTVLMRFFGWEPVEPDKPSFTDVSPKKWYYAAVETALAHGAIAASSTAFHPGKSITRAEMVEMLLRGMGYAALAGQVEQLYDCHFTDVTAKKGFITMAYDLGIVDGVSKTRFNPNGTATREQAAAVMVRAYDLFVRQSEAVSGIDSSQVRLAVETPEAAADAAFPQTPLEPVLELYGALRTLRQEKQDMSRVVLCLTAGGVQTVVANNTVVNSSALTAGEVKSLLNRPGVSLHYSTRYESAYLIYRPNAYQTTTVWYQSDESLLVKLQLARLFGVTKYMLV